jgi:hypothetical protein
MGSEIIMIILSTILMKVVFKRKEKKKDEMQITKKINLI